jgi:ataxia telangiectasia mutated family protein
MNAHHCEARDVLTLLGACLDRPFVPPSSAPFLVLGPISQAKIQSSRNTYLERYLLLLEDREEYQALPPTIPEVSNSVATKHLTTQLETRLLEFCHSEIEKTIDRWREGARKNSQSFTSDMLRIITSSCIVFSALCGLSDMEHQRVRMLEAKVDNLADTISNSLVKETEQYKVDAVIESFATSLPEIQHLPELDQSYFRRTGVFTLAMHLSRALVGRNEFRQSFLVDDGFMDVDEDRNSQGAGGNSNPHSDVPRHDIQAATDAAALRATCLAYCHLVSSISADSYDRECIPPSFVDYITSIHEAELIRCRPFIKALFSSRLRLPKVSCLQLVERVSEALIHPLAREYNSSEVANTIVLDVLIGVTADLDLAATDKETQDLYQAVQELYSFYIKEIEKIGVRRSVELQKTLADFLHGLLEHNPDFAKGSRAPSVRTSLFELLQQGEVAVKYHIADRLPRIFEYFVLPEHEKILQDIDDSLPSDIHWKEGLAIRLLSLSKLASRWHTLLRQGVYRIFATAGSVDHATEHAKRCIQDVAKTRDLGSSQMLFRLFAPQIIFTWLDRKRKFSEIPYLAFDYASLEALIRDIESEAVGQAIMLGLQSELDYLAQILGTSVPAMLQRNIGKAAAYTISWDTCKGSARNRSDASNAMLLREMVGHEQYATLIQAHFPTVLGYILQTVDQEERVTKPLEKRTAFAGPAKALAEMNKISHSSQKFELGIEPSFNAYYLIDQLERLCRRTGDDPARFWRPQVYTFTMRMLLDRLHPSLGSLHARSIIRKIRILVALAGEVAFTGYALEMALQSLRPFITDMQCAEDTLGIVQYLFDHGMEYLLSNLSFVTGIGLSILISIRVFLGSSQESTTQESQHTATMDKAERFHKWLTQYLEKYADTIPVTKENADLVRAFRLIITAASRIRAEGNSFKGSEESRLLLQILDDVRSNRRLLNNTSREVALDLLCRNFQPAVSAWDDVLGSDAAVAKYAPQVWESCQRSNIGDGYLLWAARVLGRAFSAHGEVRRKVNQSRPWIITDRSAKSSHGRTSREAIIETMLGLFSSNDCKEASLAETTTRLLILRLPSYVYADEVTNRIPKHIAEALNLQVVTESVARTAVSVEELKRNALPAAGKPVSTWIRDLAVSLCHFAPHDPILSSLAKLLLGINAMAPALFPYILHLVLLEEYDGDRRVRQAISEALSIWLSDCDTLTAPYVRILINAILYLRSQPVPKEITRVDRDQWLEVDYLKAARAAGVCGMYRSALLFAETSSGQPIVKQASRRSSLLIKPPSIPLDVQLLIYKNLDEPDSFYGVDRGYSLSTVLDRLDHEADGIKSLLFRGARLDSQIRHSDATQPSDSRGFIKSLIHLNMNNITHTLLSSEQFHDIGDDAIESTLHAARKLGQWDIKAPEGNHSESSTLFKAFQGLHYAPDLSSAKSHLDGQLLTTMKSIAGGDKSTSIKSYLRTLAALTESDEIINTPRPDQLLDVWDKLKSRESWMRAGE